MNTLKGFLGATDEQSKKGFVPNREKCGIIQEGLEGEGEEMGFCLPVGVTETQTKFNTRQEFSDIGDFFIFLYDYSVFAAMSLAALFLIIGGLQWITSAGNPESINSAKKKISGALIGLAIAVGAFTILNTVDKNLVQMKIPDIYLIRSMPLLSAECSNIEGKKFAEAMTAEQIKENWTAEQTQKYLEDKYETVDFNIFDRYKTECGDDYFISDADARVCRGTSCPKRRSVCVNKPWGTPVPDWCVDANIGGLIYASSMNLVDGYAFGLLTGREGWEWPWVEDEDEVYLTYVCMNGAYANPGVQMESTEFTISEDTRVIYYTINTHKNNGTTPNDDYKSVQEKAVAWCNKQSDSGIDRGGIKGYALTIDFEEFSPLDESDRHIIGKGGQDLGNSSDYQFYTRCMLQNVDQNQLFSSLDLENGIRVDIDVSKIQDIDTNENPDKFYPEFAQECP